jgi:hypothetical protein
MTFADEEIDKGLADLISCHGFGFHNYLPLVNLRCDKKSPDWFGPGISCQQSSLNGQSCEKLPGAERGLTATARPITAAAR